MAITLRYCNPGTASRILDCLAKPGNDGETQPIETCYRTLATARPAKTGTKWARNSADP